MSAMHQEQAGPDHGPDTYPGPGEDEHTGPSDRSGDETLLAGTPVVVRRAAGLSAVIGAGAWGTALAARLAGTRPTTLWARSPQRAAEIQVARENTRYLAGHTIPDALTVTADAGAALRSAAAVLLAVPAQSLRAITATFECPSPTTRSVSTLAWRLSGGTVRM